MKSSTKLRKPLALSKKTGALKKVAPTHVKTDLKSESSVESSKTIYFPQEFLPLASTIGDFIHYWGFRRIHGQIWCALYLHAQPMSGADLCRILNVSKALVSPAITELLSHQLISPAGGDAKTKLYTANADVFSVIRHILQTREKQLILQAAKTFQKLERKVGASSKTSLNSARIQQLGSMIAGAEQAIEAITLGLAANSLEAPPLNFSS